MKVNLTPTMHAKLVELSDRFGMAPSAVATMAIAEYVANKNAGLEAQREMVAKIAESVGPQLQPLIDALLENETKKEP